nr:MAG TPA: hypothetical protein [Caudoviricetes sp.]
MKYEIYSAIDAIDGDESLFMFDENDNYTVISFGYCDAEYLDNQARECGCNWSDSKNKTPRRQDMINPVLLKSFEVVSDD